MVAQLAQVKQPVAREENRQIPVACRLRPEAAARPSSLAPVFIGGCDRSGTTMLGALIGTSPDYVCLPESPFIFENALPGRLSADQHSELLSRITAHHKFLLWHDSVGSSSFVPQAEGASFSELINSLVQKFAAAQGRFDVRGFVDHTPSNILHVRRLASTFPDAKFINIIRDSRAVAASLMPLDWGPNDIFEMAELWKSRVGAGVLALRNLPPSQGLTVRYEDLVSDPLAVRSQIADFLNVPGQHFEENSKNFTVLPHQKTRTNWSENPQISLEFPNGNKSLAIWKFRFSRTRRASIWITAATSASGFRGCRRRESASSASIRSLNGPSCGLRTASE